MNIWLTFGLPLWTLVTFSGALFWCLVLAELVILTFLDDEHPGHRASSLAGLLIILTLFSDAPLWSFLTQWQTWAALVGLYFPAGVAWSFAKFYFRVRDHKDAEADAMAAFARCIKNLPKGSTYRQPEGFVTWLYNTSEGYDFRRWLSSDSSESENRISFRPLLADHRARIVGWIAYWPFSLVRFLLADFVRRLACRLYQLLQARYQAIVDRAFGPELPPCPNQGKETSHGNDELVG